MDVWKIDNAHIERAKFQLLETRRLIAHLRASMEESKATVSRSVELLRQISEKEAREKNAPRL
jgi:hypothetical protein